MDNSTRLEIICDFIETFEDFLDEKGIVIPNDEKEQSPDTASNIYGTDYGILSDRIETLLVNLRNDIVGKLQFAIDTYENDDGNGDAGDAGELLHQNVLWVMDYLKGE